MSKWLRLLEARRLWSKTELSKSGGLALQLELLVLLLQPLLREVVQALARRGLHSRGDRYACELRLQRLEAKLVLLRILRCRCRPWRRWQKTSACEALLWCCGSLARRVELLRLEARLLSWYTRLLLVEL